MDEIPDAAEKRADTAPPPEIPGKGARRAPSFRKYTYNKLIMKGGKLHERQIKHFIRRLHFPPVQALISSPNCASHRKCDILFA